jgi:hypothetical protein
MKNHLLIIAAILAGAVVGRVTSPVGGLVTTAQATTLPQAKPPRPPRYPGGKGHADQAAKRKAQEEASRYQEIHPASDDTPKAYFVTRKVVDDILKQKGCIGLRIYSAYANVQVPYEPSVLLVGVEKGTKVPYQDQVGTYKELSSIAVREYLIGQTDDRCPSNCDGTAY